MNLEFFPKNWIETSSSNFQNQNRTYDDWDLWLTVSTRQKRFSMSFIGAKLFPHLLHWKVNAMTITWQCSGWNTNRRIWTRVSTVVLRGPFQIWIQIEIQIEMQIKKQWEHLNLCRALVLWVAFSDRNIDGNTERNTDRNANRNAETQADAFEHVLSSCPIEGPFHQMFR